ncbi:MAG: hypothetical protein ACFE8L_01600 [Candidatus Hodarchaeota archaeon]
MVIKKIKKKFYTSPFIGRQLSRLKMGQSYYGIIVSTISAIALLKIAFDINLFSIIVMFPIFFMGAFIIGYYLDIKNITTMDQMKSVEMSQRFLNIANIKTQEFDLLQTEIILKGLESLREGKPVDFSELKTRYDEYKKKWAFQY